MNTLPSLALGTAQFGMNYGIANSSGPNHKNRTNEILDKLGEYGINTLDTAIGYGAAEEVLGKYGVQNYQVISKLPAIPHDTKDIKTWVRKQFMRSLERLNLDAIDGFLIHKSEDLFSSNGPVIFEALHHLKNEGLIKHIGVSIYNPSDLQFITSNYEINLVQAPLNVVDRRLEFSGWLDKLFEMNIIIHTRSVFLQGLLLMEQGAIPPKFLKWKQQFQEWHKYLQLMEIPPLIACLQYPLSHKKIDKVIVGVDSAQQLNMIVDASKNLPNMLDTTFMISDDKQLINPSNWDSL